MNRIGAAAVMAAAAMLAACGEREGEGGPTAEENRELNNAAEMLDTSPDSLIASDDAALGNGDAPAQTGDVMVSDEATDNGVAPADPTNAQ
jgi:hypothetical protein